MNRSILLRVLASVLLLTTACEHKEILKGKRESFLPDAKMISVNPGLPPVQLSSNSATNHSVAKDAKVAWKAKIGQLASGSDIHYHNGKLYAVNTMGRLSCIDAKTGQVLQKVLLGTNLMSGPVYTGMAFIDGPTPKIIISTNSGFVIGLRTSNLKELFNFNIKSPIKSSPAVINDKIIVNSVENRTFAYAANNGKTKIWETSKEAEEVIMEGSGTPTIYERNVICAYTNGDVSAINSADGTEVWTDTLFSSNTSESGFVISHIVASPIIHRGNVLVATSESKMAYIDASSGIRKWELNMGTINDPVINNDWIFVLSNNNTLACISANDGSVKWLTQVEPEEPKQKGKAKGKVKKVVSTYHGPVLINGEVKVFSSSGEFASYHPNTGKLLASGKVGTGVSRTPTVVDGRIYIVNNNAEIVCLR